MDYIYTTSTAAAKGDTSLTPPTPIKLSIDTEDFTIQIEGADGLQVSETLQTSLTKIKRSQKSGNGDVLLFGFAMAFWIGLVVFFSFAFYDLGKKNPEVNPVRVGKMT